MTWIKGKCPMGCGETLFVGEGGHITCSFNKCQNPGAIDEILRKEPISVLSHTSVYVLRSPK